MLAMCQKQERRLLPFLFIKRLPMHSIALTQLTSGGGHNSAVLYRDGHLGPTYSFPPGPFGYQGMADYTWVAPPPPYDTFQYEVLNGDQVIDDGTVYKFFQLADKAIHPGGFTYKLIGTVVETFSLNPATDVLTPAGALPSGLKTPCTATRSSGARQRWSRTATSTSTGCGPTTAMPIPFRSTSRGCR